MRKERFIGYESELTNDFLSFVSAFSNYEKGIIRFGINKDGTICGLTNIENAKLLIENKINDSIDPKPDFTFIPNIKDNTLDLIVFEGRFKPYMYKGKAYKGNDTSTIEMDRAELRRFLMDYNNTSFDELETDEDLSFTYFNNVLINSLNLSCDSNVLKTFSLINNFNHYNNAAKIISDNNSLAGLDIVIYGESINVINQRYTFTNKSIFEMYYKTLDIFKANYTYEIIEGFNRVKKEKIPFEAFREALANALVHRSYDDNSNIIISMYDEKIEITSPGGLMPFLSKEEYLNGLVSKLRNPILAGVFLRLGLIEELGSGIRRIKAVYSKTDKKPTFNVYENSIQVILPSLKCKESLTLDEEVILKVLNGYTLSTSDIQLKSGFNKPKVIRLIKGLIDKNMIAVSGNGRSTKYYRK